MANTGSTPRTENIARHQVWPELNVACEFGTSVVGSFSRCGLLDGCKSSAMAHNLTGTTEIFIQTTDFYVDRDLRDSCYPQYAQCAVSWRIYTASGNMQNQLIASGMASISHFTPIFLGALSRLQIRIDGGPEGCGREARRTVYGNIH